VDGDLSTKLVWMTDIQNAHDRIINRGESAYLKVKVTGNTPVDMQELNTIA
jgi:hypothetical protein